MENRTNTTSIVVVTGPESTGKTELSRYLSQKFSVPWVPELSRLYIEKLNRPYTCQDVETIARLQIDQFQSIVSQGHPLVIFDTDLIITKVWFDVVYQHCPGWVIDAIKAQKTRLHLLCNTDIPWVPDPVRENGGEMRDKLFDIYRNELESFGLPYQIISGVGSKRERMALRFLTNEHLI
jgi:nicotinamide riboside kinase